MKESPAIILLAAGPSTRFGTPKQLALLNGITLVRRAATEALKVSDRVLVVLGASADQVRQELSGLTVQLVENKNWAEGMASSIVCGLKFEIKENPASKPVILMVCDQPYADASLLGKLKTEYHHSAKRIVACSYHNTVGTPVLFPSDYFKDLLALRGQSGAKSIILEHIDSVVTIPFPLGNVDIDTMQDLNELNQTLDL